jgi:hypothetical protein
MATESINNVASDDWNYGRYVEKENPVDTHYRKLSQAAALSALIYGDGLELLHSVNDKIQGDVLWLLHDTISEAFHALEVVNATERSLSAQA